jgi:hypothetical protein
MHSLYTPPATRETNSLADQEANNATEPGRNQEEPEWVIWSGIERPPTRGEADQTHRSYHLTMRSVKRSRCYAGQD